MKRIVMVLIILIILLCFSYGYTKKLTELPGIARPGLIEISGNRIFILDGVTVHVHSLEDYRLLTKFGKNGQGPEELPYNTRNEIKPQMQICRGNIFLNTQQKMVLFSPDGKFISEKKLSFRTLQIVPIAENYAVAKFSFSGSGNLQMDALLFDARFQELNKLTSYRRENPERKRRRIVVPLPYIYLYHSGGKLFVTGGDQRDFIIKVFSGEGKLLDTITMPYERIKFDSSYREKVINWIGSEISFKQLPEETKKKLLNDIEFPDYLPAIRDLVVKGSNIYVQTYKEQGSRSQFLILDLKGKLLKEVYLSKFSGGMLKIDTNRMYTFHKNGFYYLEENPDAEVWELHKEEMK